MKTKVALPIFMAGECFERAWHQVIKAAWWMQDDKDINEAVEDNMAEHQKKEIDRKKARPNNPTGNKTMDRMIARARGNEPPKKPAIRKPANLQSETLRRLHEKVKKD